MLHMYVG